MYCTRYLLSA